MKGRRKTAHTMPSLQFAKVFVLGAIVFSAIDAALHPLNIDSSFGYEDSNEIYGSNGGGGSTGGGGGGGFGVARGVLGEYDEPYGFDYRREYSPKVSQIYSKYLRQNLANTGSGDSYSEAECIEAGSDDYSNDKPQFNSQDFDDAFNFAGRRVEQYERANQEYLASDPRGLNFSAFLYVSSLHSKYNELLTQQLRRSKCLSKKQIALQMPLETVPPNPWKKRKFCELESRQSTVVMCDAHSPFRRLDGKCTNPMSSNLGSNFHCHRRLLPPDYSDGVYQPRVGFSDARPLPSPRLISQLLMPDLDLNDPTLSGLHFAWGQFLVHDVFRTVQNLGLAINCCRMINPPQPPLPGSQPPPRPGMSRRPPPPFMPPRLPDRDRGDMQNQPPMPHPECLPIVNFKPDAATQMFRQTCLNTVRSLACNPCSLGPRNQLNGATQMLDLSHIYGGNLLNNSEALRSFVGGQMAVQMSLTGQPLLPPIEGIADTDTLDMTPCRPPLNNPLGVGCFRTGDGIRGNQNPFIAALTTLAVRRHNQHAESFALVNPHWDDERLFQESRRLLIAEIVRIHYGEYLPLLLGQRLMKYFHLDVRSKGFTKYNSHVEPSTFQAPGVAALRIGHSQTRSTFRVISEERGLLTRFRLKDRFFNMIDIWQGQVTPVVRGLMADPSKNIDPYGVSDLKDFLFFNPQQPQVTDLFSININRARDHGVPSYVSYLQYCSGVEIHSWKDIERFIPARKVASLRKTYRHWRDIDLFPGGLMEFHLKGAKVGPTFACLIGIQFYHWKYGDRFYFEHGGEAGSFTSEQLNDIRRKVTLSNYLCKSADMELVPSSPLEELGGHNLKISCAGMPEIDYGLWREESGGYGKRR